MTATPDPDEFGESVQATRLTRGQQVAHPTVAALVGRNKRSALRRMASDAIPPNAP